MNKFVYLIAALSFYGCGTTNQTTMSNDNSGDSKGWISLFDGKTTNGWHTYGKETAGKAWKVDDGMLHLDAASKKDWQSAEGGDIVTEEEFDNFHLQLDWKISNKGNSGIIFYIKEDPKAFEFPWYTGPEMQILDNGTPTRLGHSDAKLYTHRAGDLYDLLASKEAVKPVGEWNHVEVISKNGQLDFYLNGEHTLSTTMWNDNWMQMIAVSKFKDMLAFGTFKKGKLGLQDHGDDVWFRNIKIKRL
jgi:hypothetical protein